jgi:hypothetical protein
MKHSFALVLALALAAFGLAGCFSYSEKPAPPANVTVVPPANSPQTAPQSSGTVVVPPSGSGAGY